MQRNQIIKKYCKTLKINIMSCWTKEQLENMLEDVVNELDLSEAMIKKHGQEGTAPATLVRLVLEMKDREIRNLKAGLTCINSKNNKSDNSDSRVVMGGFIAYQIFLIEAVNQMLTAERSIIKDGFVKISIDKDYKCSDTDLAKYKIEYKHPLHLIHFGQDLHRAELKLRGELKCKWHIC